MCDPVSICLAVAAGASVVGGIVSAVGSSKEADAQAEMSRINQAAAEEMAVDAEKKGQEDVARLRMKTADLIGSQQTAFAANNIDLSSGSVADAEKSTRWAAELDAKAIALSAAQEARGYRTQGLLFQKQAELDQSKAKYAVATSILGGIAGGINFGTQSFAAGKKAGVL